MSDIDTGVVDSLKALDPDRPIREADIAGCDRGTPFKIIARCSAIRTMTDYGTPQFRKTEAGRAMAALCDRAGVTYVIRWNFPAGGKQEEVRI